MKNNSLISKTTARLSLVFTMLFLSILTFAQEAVNTATETTRTTTTTEEWYANPLYIIIGIVALLLVIVLLTRGRRA